MPAHQPFTRWPRMDVFPAIPPLFALLLLTFLLPSASPALAQEFCIDSSARRGCPGMTVRLAHCRGVRALYDFGLGQGVSSQPNSPPYTQPGKYSIRQVIEGTGKDTLFVDFIEVFKDSIPKVRIEPCSQRKIRVVIEEDYYAAYQVIAGSLPPVSLPPKGTTILTLPATGRINIQVRGLFVADAGNCTPFRQEVEVVENFSRAAITRIELKNGTEAALTYQKEGEGRYFLEEREGSGAFRILQEITAQSGTLNLNNRRFSSTPYCYRLRSTDPCDGSVTFTDPLCTSWLTVSSDQKINQISWLPYPGGGAFQGYELLRGGTSLVTLTNPAANRFTDIDVQCTQQYCYQLRIRVSGEREVLLPAQCIITTTSEKPAPAQNLLAEPGSNGEIQLRWETDPQAGIGRFFLKIERAGQVLEEVEGVNNTFTHTGTDPSRFAYCYELTLEDDCLNRSAPVRICTILLRGERVNREHQLSWTPFEGFSGRFDYFVEVLNEEGQVARILGPFRLGITSFTDLPSRMEFPVMRYRVVAQNRSNPAQRLVSNVVRLKQEPELEIPEAFTPNQDGLNDTFRITGFQILAYSIRIYNRWGNLVFFSQEMDTDWDGSFQGQPAPAGLYTWLIEGFDTAREPYQRSGTVLVIR